MSLVPQSWSFNYCSCHLEQVWFSCLIIDYLGHLSCLCKVSDTLVSYLHLTYPRTFQLIPAQLSWALSLCWLSWGLRYPAHKETSKCRCLMWNLGFCFPELSRAMRSTLCCTRSTVYTGLTSKTWGLEKSHAFLDMQRKTGYNTQKVTKYLPSETLIFPQKVYSKT